MWHTFLLLLMVHFALDFAFQSQWVADRKRRDWAPGNLWFFVLLGHAASHGLAVALLTNNAILGLYETAAHFGIDYLRSNHPAKLSRGWDQVLHVLCKAIWSFS